MTPAPQLARLLIENLMVGLLVLTMVVMLDQVREPWHSLSNIAVAVALVLDGSFQEAKQWAIELNQLSELGQLLQSCLTEHEAYLLIGTALNKFLPECSGRPVHDGPGRTAGRNDQSVGRPSSHRK